MINQASQGTPNQDETTDIKQCYLQVLDKQDVKIAGEITTADYSLTKNELRAWFLFLSELTQDNVEQGNIYVFDAIRFADKLGISEKLGRGQELANLFIRLSRNTIDIRSRETNKRGEHSILHSYIIASVVYNQRDRMLKVEIPNQLKQFIFALQAGSYLQLDIDEILALNSVKAMRIFIYLKNLDRQGINDIYIDTFKRDLHLADTAMQEYKFLKQRILTPVIEEIRERTGYKNFYIKDDGKPGRRATTLHFGFHADSIPNDYLLTELVGYNMAEKLSKQFSEAVCVAIYGAVSKGFNPKYIGKKFDGLPDNQIIGNLHLVQDIILKDRTQKQEKSRDDYGRYFLKAVVDNWVAKNTQRSYDARIAAEEKTFITRQRQEHEQQEMVLHSITNVARKKAVKFLAEMNLDSLLGYLARNRQQLTVLGGRKGFDFEKAKSRKRNYREYTILVKFFMGKIMSGEIDLPDKYLFENR